MHIIGRKTEYKFQGFLKVSTPRSHPQGVSNTKEYKYQYTNIRSKMPNVPLHPKTGHEGPEGK
jgi:hypothetical protein